MNNYRSEYNSKLIKKEQILKLLKKGDRLMCHGGEVSILSFLDENIDALPGIDVYTIFNLTRPYGFLDNTHKDKLYHYAGWSTPPVRKAMEDGNTKGPRPSTSAAGDRGPCLFVCIPVLR